MKLGRITTAALFAATLAVAAPARAAIISGTYDITATGLSNGFPNFSASITLMFDTSASVSDSTTNIVLNSLSFPLGSAISYCYFKNSDLLAIGGLNQGANGVQTLTNDFSVAIASASTNPRVSSVTVTSASDGTSFASPTNPRNISFRFTPTTAVPEPATLALLGASAGLGGLVARRRRRSVTRA